MKKGQKKFEDDKMVLKSDQNWKFEKNDRLLTV